MNTNEAALTAGSEVPSKTSITRELVASVLVGGVGPYVVYTLLRPHASEVASLLAGGLLPTAWEVVSLVRHRRLDPVSTLNILALGVNIALVCTSGSARMLLVKESFVTGAIGAAFLLTLLGRRPAIYYLARQAVTGNVQANVERYEDAWVRAPTMRWMMRAMTAVWGGVMLSELGLRIAMVLLLTIEQMLVVGPIVFYGITAALALWTARLARRHRPRIKAERTGA